MKLAMKNLLTVCLLNLAAIANAAMLEVPPCTITAQPRNTAVCPGAPAGFGVTASGKNVRYQWRKDGAPIAGATSSTYIMNTTSTKDVGRYDVVISGDCGAVTSKPATLELYDVTAISKPPTDVAACSGSKAALTVTAKGAGLTYQWRKGGVDIPGATSRSLTIAKVVATDTGAYDVVVRGACGTATSPAAKLTIDATAILAQPQDLTVCAGTEAVLRVEANGQGLNYQWRKGGVAIPGAGSNAYAIRAARAEDAGSYDVVVRGACGSVSSTRAKVTVRNSTQITAQPASATVCAGAPATLSVTAPGTELRYQWVRDGREIAGATASSYAIRSVSATDAGTYAVIVAGPCGLQTSSPAAISLSEVTAISAQPSDAVVCSGGKATFSVAATGSALKFQWRRNGVEIAGATSPRLEIASAKAVDAGTYDVFARGACGTVRSSAAKLTLEEPTAIVEQPRDVLLCSAGSARLELTASGRDLVYQWLKGGKAIAGATSSSYTIPTVTGSDTGPYSAFVSGACGSITSSPAVVALDQPPVIVQQPADAIVCPGTRKSLSVQARGTNLTYQWRRDGVDIAGATAKTYEMTASRESEAWIYDVRVQSACGTVMSTPAKVVLEEGTVIVTQPAGLSVCPGSRAEFTVEARGKNVSYQWRKGGLPIRGARGTSYTIPATAANDTGVYDVVVSGACGSVTSSPATLMTFDRCSVEVVPD